VTGAEAALRTLAGAGVEVCFANPGTTELAFVAALDAVRGIRPVLGLFEGVCTGAADGFARMTRRPAATLLHLGPGFANGIANLHNARRARSPIVNLIGDHATWHRAADAPLQSDIESLAAPVSIWLRRTRSAGELAADAAQACAAALSPPGGVATLVVAADHQAEAGAVPAPARRPGPARPPSPDRVASTARLLRTAGAHALLLGGDTLRRRGLAAAARIAAATGARLVCDTFVARLERGAGIPRVERIPYFPEAAIQFLAPLRGLVLVDTREPVAFFGYPGVPSHLAPPSAERATLASPEEDGVAALEALADELAGDAAAPSADPASRLSRPSGALSPETLGAALAATQPEGAIVVDEGATSGLPWFVAAAGAPPHDVLGLTGGAIGQGLPCATGAALACPERPVIALQADGAGAYTLQALWTQAREGLNVTTLLCSNRSYRILRVELARAGIAEPGPAALALTDLSRPPLDWCALARGFGVPSSRPADAAELVATLEKGFAEPGPKLVEVAIP
jgi:acetolactate synthase-1/2/3 large subunit